MACGLGPTQFRAAADRLALLLNQDGDLPNNAQRARRRYLTIDTQGGDGMSRIHGRLDPEARATVEAGGATIISDIDRQGFVDAAKPVYDKFAADPKLQDLIKQVQATE